jgi:hypothetical protein
MDLMGAAMEDRAVPAVGRRVRTPATFMVVDMSLSMRLFKWITEGHEWLSRLLRARRGTPSADCL